MTIDLSTLNESQRDAVKWQNGPLLVVAGPGSGKTRVLTYRVARLIEESPDARFRVLGLRSRTRRRRRCESALTRCSLRDAIARR